MRMAAYRRSPSPRTSASLLHDRQQRVDLRPSPTGHLGLFAYGVNVGETYRHAAVYVDKIFRGAKPADLPFFAKSTPTRISFMVDSFSLLTGR